jgi:2-polyprenyl-6-methoxyphenol hydroxylase-like FAD-dependent oxidoreductase
VRAVVVGGGIGGLAAAIALRRRGIEVTLLERETDPREIGAGITLWPNAMRALRSLDLADAIAEAGASALLGDLRSWHGDVLTRPTVQELERRFGEPGIAIHRADLRRLLLAALDPSVVRLGARYVGSREEGDAVTACLADGGRERADVLVGADGLHSTVRARLWGEAPPRYAGYTAWRGVVPAVPAGTAFESWGRGERFGLVPIGMGRGYWFATAPGFEGGAGGDGGDDAAPGGVPGVAGRRLAP